VSLVRDTASMWESQISREATIQIRPREGLDMEQALADASRLASGFAGVRSATVVDREATSRLLEPWLGTGLNIDDLPVPRLVVVTIDESNPPDFGSMRSLLAADIPTSSLDDHRTWVDRLVAMARTTVTIGIAVLVLMLSATVLSVVFATRGAMAGNGHIIEVLHFVGAEARFIAAEFRRHFLLTGMKGALVGGVLATQSRNARGRSGNGTVRQFRDWIVRLSRRRADRALDQCFDGGDQPFYRRSLSQRDRCVPASLGLAGCSTTVPMKWSEFPRTTFEDR
jgi:cell division protein FtsX